MRARHVLPTVVFSLAVLVGTAEGYTPPTESPAAMIEALSRGMLTYPLERGVLQTKLAPSYLVGEKSESHGPGGGPGGGSGGDLYINMDGWAATGGVTYGLSDHWGVGLIFGYFDISGSRSFELFPEERLAIPKAPITPIQNAVGEGHGSVLMANLIWDPRSGDRFRCPIYAGVGYLNLEEKADSPSLGIRRTGEVNGPSVTLGVAPSFRIGRSRATAYFLASKAIPDNTGTVVDYNPGTGAVNRSIDAALPKGFGENMIGILGVEWTWLPWGLSVGWIPDMDGWTGYSLKWTRRWDLGSHR